ncbi:MAG TPA: hypothetical protein VKA34_07395, partial [Balneolales bacterium]|nr:hypothetical protein [Balneolales bacterium]
MRGLRILCRYFLALGILIISTVCAYSQVTLDSLPPNGMNHRFYRDVFHVKRPGLSINGFDNSGDDSHGYGLKQIIEKLYISDPIEYSTFKDIVTYTGKTIKDPNYNTSNYSINTVETN